MNANNAFAVTGIQQFVMSFEVGVVLEDDSQWQAPAHCFPDDGEKTKKSDYATSSRIEEVADGRLEAARLLSKFAGAAAF